MKNVNAPVFADLWRPHPAPSLPRSHRLWLSRPGALTAGLRQLGTVELSVLRECVEPAPAEEACALGIHPRAPIWVREILMRIDGVPCVAARSCTPLQHSRGIWQAMRRLKNRPLADMLYHDPTVTRSGFAVARLDGRSGLYGVAVSTDSPRIEPGRPGEIPLWARRSVFWRAGAGLVVAECFLADFWTLIPKPK